MPDTGHQIKSSTFGSGASLTAIGCEGSTFGTNPSSSTTSNENWGLRPRSERSSNLYKFPWFSHINASKLEDFIPGALESGGTELTTGSLGASLPTPVFALANILGSIKISNESITVVTNTSCSEAKLSELDELNNHAIRTGPNGYQLAKYFETHYKYTYSIRTSNSLAISYLRLPQSSIQKNE